jgi:hypothetical protein
MFVIGLKNCATISPNIPRLIEHKLGHFLTILWTFIFRNEFSIKKNYVHTTNLTLTVRKYQLESWTLIFGHIALSWLLSNFTNICQYYKVWTLRPSLRISSKTISKLNKRFSKLILHLLGILNVVLWQKTFLYLLQNLRQQIISPISCLGWFDKTFYK